MANALAKLVVMNDSFEVWMEEQITRILAYSHILGCCLCYCYCSNILLLRLNNYTLKKIRVSKFKTIKKLKLKQGNQL